MYRDLEQIEEYLYEYENSLITDGLHVMNAEEAQDFCML